MTVTVSLGPPPVFHAQDAATGAPAVGYKLFTYAAGTTTKQTTYTDYTAGTPNTNPIILDANGNCNLWIDSTEPYKLVLVLPTDTDPPTSPVWTVDNFHNQIAPFSINVSFLPKALDAETLRLYTFPEDVLFRPNFALSKGYAAINATAPTVMTLYKNPTFTDGTIPTITGGTVVGTVSYSTGGAFTFASPGGVEQKFFAGESLGVASQAFADATASGAFTLRGIRTSGLA